MENNILRQFAVNYKQIISDEIALEGLEGIGIDLLWRRVEKRISTQLTEKLKKKYWTYIVNNKKLSFYELPEPFGHVDIVDRFTLVDEITGHLLEPEEYLDGPYEYKQVVNEHGSCRFYETRIQLVNLMSLTYENVISKYGDRLAIVASIEERWHALAPHRPITCLNQMMPSNYCLLELIGKSRDNGQMTVGKSNLHKIIKDPKTLFYIRKHLQDLDLIRVHNITQLINGRGVKCLLIRLKRFHKPGVLSMPKRGMLRNVIDYLLKAPGHTEEAEILVKMGILSQKQNRRLQKTVNIFTYEDKTVPTAENPKSKKVSQKRKYICLSSKSYDSSDSEEATNEPPTVCQYKVGISLMRQAYEQFLEAGLQGLTQVQLSSLLGIEFYTARAICRTFRLKNIVREYLEDKGKQRTARFIAVVATEKMDKTYEEQKKKFLEYLNQCKEEESILDTPETTTNDNEVSLIKIKKEEDNHVTSDDDLTVGNDITEIKVLDGLKNTKPLGNFKKNPTLRQLKFANGVLKVLNEKLCISGYMNLSTLASKEVNEPPMDTKALKSFIQRLATDGHLKMYKIKWPGLQRYSVFICAHHIKITDPIIKAKYKEICLRTAYNVKANSIKKDTVENNYTPATARRSYPRYLKIQKLHEFIMNITYFNFVKPQSHTLPQGFVCFIDLFPEATVEFLINNLSTATATEIYDLITDSQLQLKLKDAPPLTYKTLTKSKPIQNSITVSLKILAMLGLVQLIRQNSAVTNIAGANNCSNFLFYVNRHAKILDTTGIWPRNRTETQELSFHFETANDVAKFWSDVYNISTNTEINLSERKKKRLYSPLRSFVDVQLHDTGERFGDGLGPCGFDSCFFMEMSKLWQTFYTRPVKRLVPKKKLQIEKPKFEAIKKTKRKPKARRPKKRVAEKPPPREVPPKRRRYDSSVKWSREDDLIITICKAAITIMSPCTLPGSLIVRNIVAKDLLSIKDPKKTKGLCHSRALTIETNISLVHEKQCIINELRRRRDLVQKYEGLLKKLKLKYSTNMTKFINKSRIPMLELVWIIFKMLNSKSYLQRVPSVAFTLDEFNEHFNVTTSTANKLCNMYRVPDNIALKEAIILTVMQTLDTEQDPETARKIYTIFQMFEESDLRIAVEQLRKCTAIAAKEKLFNNQFRKLDFEDIVQSSYKISVFYRHKWINRLNTEFAHNVGKIIDTLEFENNIKGSAEMNCAVCELEICNIIDIESTTFPLITTADGVPIEKGEVSAVTIDTKYNLKTGTTRLKKKTDIKVTELYKYPDFVACLEYLSSYGSVYEDTMENSNIDTKDDIIFYLKQKGEKGATFVMLQNDLRYDHKTLLNKLLQLESDNIIKRVGFYENIIILIEHYKSWSTEMDDKYVICTPWLKLTSGIRVDIFLKWASVTMNFIFEKPGCSVACIADKSELITYRAVQDICMFLEKNECITLKTVQMTQPDLFSDEDIEPEFFDYNPFYAPENILAFPTKNCMTKYCYLKKSVFAHYLEKRC